MDCCWRNNKSDFDSSWSFISELSHFISQILKLKILGLMWKMTSESVNFLFDLRQQIYALKFLVIFNLECKAIKLGESTSANWSIEGRKLQDCCSFTTFWVMRFLKFRDIYWVISGSSDLKKLNIPMHKSFINNSRIRHHFSNIHQHFFLPLLEPTKQFSQHKRRLSEKP